MHYDVIYIYDNKDADEKEKILLTAKVKESFDVYKVQQDQKDLKEKKESLIQERVDQSDTSLAFLKRDLEKYYTLIDRVIEKIERILSIYQGKMDSYLKEKLTLLITPLRQVKNITNIDKLRIV